MVGNSLHLELCSTRTKTFVNRDDIQLLEVIEEKKPLKLPPARSGTFRTPKADIQKMLFNKHQPGEDNDGPR